MPWNLLIFPLVGGYYILTRSYFFKFIQQRLDRQRLIFESVLIGSFICGLAILIRLGISYFDPSFSDTIYRKFPFKEPFTITSISILGLSIFLTEITNLFLNKTYYAKKAIKAVGNEFELLLKTSFVESKLLLFTLCNDKFYIAWVKELPNPSISNYVRVVPAMSGFRTDRKELEFTTEYLLVYSQLVKENNETDIKNLKTDIVIDISQVMSVSFFDFKLNKKFDEVKLENTRS